MKRTPLLLVNGYAATAKDWDPTFLAALEHSFELICPDNRGIGSTSPNDLDGPLTIESMAIDLEALLEARGIESLPVVGWSMGGFIAQALAVRAPQRLEALVLLSTDAGGPDAVLPEPAWARLTDHTGTPREQATRLIDLLFPPAVAAEIDRQFGDLVAAARAALPPAGLAAQEAAMEAWHAGEQPKPAADPLPVLAVCGGKDIVIPPANADRLAAKWQGCRVVRCDGGGHAFMAQEPEWLADLITSFLRE